jgi:hypothetical protein
VRRVEERWRRLVKTFLMIYRRSKATIARLLLLAFYPPADKNLTRVI